MMRLPGAKTFCPEYKGAIEGKPVEPEIWGRNTGVPGTRYNGIIEFRGERGHATSWLTWVFVALRFRRVCHGPHGTARRLGLEFTLHPPGRPREEAKKQYVPFSARTWIGRR